MSKVVINNGYENIKLHKIAVLSNGHTHYRLYGDGPHKIVILNGLTAPFCVFDEFIGHFDKEQYTILLYDYYGRSYSCSENCLYDDESYVQQLELLLNYIGWTGLQIDIIAYSWACGLSCKLVQRNQLPMSNLTLIAPAFTNKSQVNALMPFNRSWLIQCFFSRFFCLGVMKYDTYQNAATNAAAIDYWRLLKSQCARQSFRTAISKTLFPDLLNWPAYFKDIGLKVSSKFSVILGQYDRKAPGEQYDCLLQTVGRLDNLDILPTKHLVPFELPQDCANIVQRNIRSH